MGYVQQHMPGHLWGSDRKSSQGSRLKPPPRKEGLKGRRGEEKRGPDEDWIVLKPHILLMGKEGNITIL